MTNPLVLFGLALMLSLVAVRLSLPLARRSGLLALPGEHRLHPGETPLSGGLAMVLAGTAAVLLLEVPVDRGLATAILLLLVVGVVDDRFSLPYALRFVFQIIAMLMLMLVDHVRLAGFGHVFGSDPVLLGDWSGFLTVFAGVGVINAINMVDGMDGLAGSLALVCLLGGLVFIALSPAADPPLVWVIIGVVAGFLVFNLRWFDRRCARVFMGDAGSMVLGLVLAWMLIRHSQGPEAAFPPVLALWLLALPLYDAVGVLLRRPLRGGSPFDADWRHTHHLLLRLGCSTSTTLIILLASALLLAGFGIWMTFLGIPEHLLFYLFLGLFVIYLLLMESGERIAGSSPGTFDVYR